MSKTTCVEPAALNTFTLPSAPTATITRFETVWPVRKLRLAARGGDARLDEKIVRKLGDVGSVTATFTTTAVASNGTTVPSVTSTTISAPAPTGAPLRVSRMRVRADVSNGSPELPNQPTTSNTAWADPSSL
jgi:hypothetical protein